jgi:hypothetical protein
MPAAFLLISILLVADALCYLVTLPVTIDVQRGIGTLAVGKLDQPQSLRVLAHGREVQNVAWPGNGEQLALPDATDIHISLQLQRPETPSALDLVLRSGRTLHITLDRNDRLIIDRARQQLAGHGPGSSLATSPRRKTQPSSNLPRLKRLFSTLPPVAFSALCQT